MAMPSMEGKLVVGRQGAADARRAAVWRASVWQERAS